MSRPRNHRRARTTKNSRLYHLTNYTPLAGCASEVRRVKKITASLITHADAVLSRLVGEKKANVAYLESQTPVYPLDLLIIGVSHLIKVAHT